MFNKINIYNYQVCTSIVHYYKTKILNSSYTYLNSLACCEMTLSLGKNIKSSRVVARSTNATLVVGASRLGGAR